MTKKGYPKGVTYEERYGLEKALKIKEKLSLKNKGRKYTPEIIKKYQNAQLKISKGKTLEERYGIERAKIIIQKIKDRTKQALNKPEVRAKISAWQLGRKMPKEVIEKRLKTMKERGYKHSEETKKKMAETAKRNGFGFPRSLEIREKARLKCIGQKRTEEQKKKIGDKNRNPSEEKRRKMREKRALQITPFKDTTIEIKIQNFLKQLNIEFFTHQYIKNIEHGYQCDILIPSINLVIECDGDYWHNYPNRTEIDNKRTQELINKGYIVLRLWEREIRNMEINQFKNKLEEITNGC